MKTKIYLNYLESREAERMTNTMPFLFGGNEGKEELLATAQKLYGEGVTLDFALDNGRYPSEWRAHFGDNKHFYTIIQFKQERLTEQAINALGKCDEWDWRYFYAISLCKEDRLLYLISFSNKYSPNWNQVYKTQHFKPLSEVDFPILKEGFTIYRMDNALHAAINEVLVKSEPIVTEEEGCAMIMVKDQHGNYTKIVGTTMEAVFREYADKYTGYRNYRRQMASEWVIVDDKTRLRFEAWKRTAKGLKSDFDKFYGGGIVD